MKPNCLPCTSATHPLESDTVSVTTYCDSGTEKAHPKHGAADALDIFSMVVGPLAMMQTA